MATKRMYRRTSVKKIARETLDQVALLKGGDGTCVGLDVGKAEIVAVVRWSDGAFECPWSVKNPSEISELISLLQTIRTSCQSLVIGMESTGTYGEAVRFALTKAGLIVHRVSGKASSDYKEIFDGVPSQHDGKDAAIIAELTCFGKATPWPYQPPSELDQELRHQVQRMDAFVDRGTQWSGRLEAMLAKHWPELTSLLKLKSSTLHKIISHYGTPAQLADDPEAASKLWSWGRGLLKEEKIRRIIESANGTLGVPLGKSETVWLQEIASEIRAAMLEVDACRDRLSTVAGSHEGMRDYCDAVGPVTLCVIWATAGDPRGYASSGAFLKALGLNLKELSSGMRQGQLAITKRGPSLARKYIYFWAMRASQRPELARWYHGFQRVGTSSKGSSEHRKMKGLIALMRKLSRSLWYARAHDQTFDYAKVYPGRPLEKRRRRRRRVKASASE